MCRVRCASAGDDHPHVGLQQFDKLLDRKSCVTDDGSQSALGELLVVWDADASMRRLLLPENHVAPGLMVEWKSDFGQRLHEVSPRTDRKPRR